MAKICGGCSQTGPGTVSIQIPLSYYTCHLVRAYCFRCSGLDHGIPELLRQFKDLNLVSVACVLGVGQFSVGFVPVVKGDCVRGREYLKTASWGGRCRSSKYLLY